MALLERGRTQYGQHILQTVCDGCVREGLQGQLHGTLYRVDDTHVLCEVHQIIAGRKAPTLQFRQAVERAQRQQKEQTDNESSRCYKHTYGVMTSTSAHMITLAVILMTPIMEVVILVALYYLVKFLLC